MHATPARHVEHPETFRETADERCDRGGEKECDKSGADEEEPGHDRNDSRRWRRGPSGVVAAEPVPNFRPKILFRGAPYDDANVSGLNEQLLTIPAADLSKDR